MFCKKCGNELPSNTTFCSQCGEKITKDVLPSIVVDAKNNSDGKISRLVMIIPAIVGIIVFILAYGIARYGTQEILSFISGNSKNQNTQNSVYSTNFADSPEAFLDETVKELKKGLPMQIDENTSWVNVTAEPKAIRYHYIVTNVDTSLDTKDKILVGLKNFIISNVCNTSDAKIFFEKGINMEASYVVSGTQESYSVVLTKNDCSLGINQNVNTTINAEPIKRVFSPDPAPVVPEQAPEVVADNTIKIERCKTEASIASDGQTYVGIDEINEVMDKVCGLNESIPCRDDVFVYLNELSDSRKADYYNQYYLDCLAK